MVIIEMNEEKREEMSELCEKMLHYGGKLMQCLENLPDGSESEAMGQRSPRGDYRGRGGMRDDLDEMGERYEDMSDYGMRGGYRTRRRY